MIDKCLKKYSITVFAWAVVSLLIASCALEPQNNQTAKKVEIIKTEQGYQLLRGGEPYQIKGAGIDQSDMASFAAHGGTAFRTWSSDNGQEILDRAQALNLSVVMCIWIDPERKDFDYNDQEAVQKQLAFARGEVMKYKDHPALLAWIIGNELNLESKNPRVYDAINGISKMIHEIDPNHPTTTALAGFSPELEKILTERAPDLDFISIQMYGELARLPSYVKEMQYSKPYFITEWGSIGHWEMPKTSWGAPVEQDSSAKAANYLKSYQNVIEPFQDQVLGSFVFLWGQKQERTPTWYGMFTETGEETETIDVMHKIWTGVWPENRTPKITSPMLLNGKNAFQSVKLIAGQNYQASIKVQDDDAINYRWEIKPESDSQKIGGDFEESINNVAGLIVDTSLAEIELTAPKNPGAYRLLVYASDENNHAAHANIPFLVTE